MGSGRSKSYADIGTESFTTLTIFFEVSMSPGSLQILQTTFL